jgi:hypothetical protein
MRQFLAVAFTAITAMLTAPIEARVFTADDFSFKPANDACRKLPAVVPKDLVSALPDDVASVQWVDVANDGRCDLFALTRGGDMNHPPLVYFAKRLDTGFDQPNDMSGNAQVIPVYPKDGGPPFLITRAGTAENPYPRVEFVLHWNASRSLLDTGQDQTGESAPTQKTMPIRKTRSFGCTFAMRLIMPRLRYDRSLSIKLTINSMELRLHL